ncbi:MAG TPA: chemotaxis protein CheB [Opitutaceae bacterium]|jgi:two-component system CheB/CheR fusion protein|nr:chemotaxis protein CheB [Opitutaceae bacterium]
MIPADNSLGAERPPGSEKKEPVDETARPHLPFPVVAIGGSAGGLEAFLEFFKAMPAESGMAFVLIQHLPPDRDSLLADIVRKNTPMAVSTVEDGGKIEANHVYVTRPGRTISITGGIFSLSESVTKPGHQRPIDDFMRSLADDQRERAIGIIISGMGSNGTAGAQAIKVVGGLCIAQEPETAKYPSMPRSMIDAGVADFVLKIEEMPQALLRYAKHPYAAGEPALEAEATDQQSVKQILIAVRLHSKHDFSGYKKPTVMRRIQRRMGLHQIGRIEDYARLVRQNPAEVSMLTDDLMIHVTGFFRDSEVWDRLDAEVIRPLMQSRDENEAVRVWVTACATGEEAYTIAMLLLEGQQALGRRFDLKVFATDTAERSLGHARAGLFAGGIESDLTPERLARFFTPEGALYRIKKELRDIVTFAPQNILQDPPFSRIDVATCRNLLIYLEAETQQRVLSLLHFSLRPGGVLVLGSSETVSGMDECFEPIDKRLKFYRRVGGRHRSSLEFPPLKNLYGDLRREPLKQAQPDAEAGSVARLMLLDRFAPPSVVIDASHRIVYMHGDTSAFLDQRRGQSLEIEALLPEPLRGLVATALNNASTGANGTTVRGAGMEITVSSLTKPRMENHFLVTFGHGDDGQGAGDSGSASKHQMKDDIGRLRLELGRTTDEHQATVELLRASNEEITSINEELQSTNEELETGKEELQSLNEELTTSNTQLQSKMEELEGTTNDLGSLLSSTDIAVIFLDNSRKIRRFTPSARDLVDVIPSDVGRNISDLALKFGDPDFFADIDQVLQRLAPIEREVESRSRRTYMRRVLPYRTGDNRIEGVVITFVDITQRKAAEAGLRQSEELHRIVLDSLTEHAILVLDTEARVATWPASAERCFGYSSGEIIGKPASTLNGDMKKGHADDIIAAALASGSGYDEHWCRRKDGSTFWGSYGVSNLRDGYGKHLGYVLVIRDFTERKRAADSLERAKLNAELANAAKDEFLANVSHELRTPLASILLWTTVFKDAGTSEPELMTEAMEAIRNSAEQQKGLIEDLIDTARIESGKLRLEPSLTGLAGVIESAMHTLYPSASAKGVEVELNLDPNLGNAVVDPVRFQQIIWNLVGNAVKFTPTGGTVAVDCRRSSEEIVVTVTDTGDGISADVMPVIFKRFGQGANGSQRSTSGLGLGLSITHHLVTLHGGTLEAKSPGPGKGSVFTVRLPAKSSVPDGRADDGSSSSIPGASIKGKRILLVEDDASLRRILTVILEGAGATVDAADSAQAALHTMKTLKPNFIVSDIGMPKMDGNDLIRAVRKIEAEAGLGHIPALALTAFAGARSKAIALASGFDGWLAKPAEPTQILEALDELAPHTAG